ncbi:hypothetical protein [Streptomyces sp. NPDC058672]|uniref:hypothetical protein n=1 Tax=Streptomyces sp. NPDC058672 TaxID=3346591 RepID=UPI00365D5EBC
MTSTGEQHLLANRLGTQAEAGAWCVIDKIPKPPEGVLQAAGSPRLRPGWVRPLGLIGMTLGVLLLPLIGLLALLSSGEEAVQRWLASKEEKERLRTKKQDEKRRDAIIAERGLDRLFDGNWQDAAGQFLLRWYSHSTHHQRLVLATEEGIALAAPPRRVTVRREKRMEIVARLSTEEAVLVDPFNGEFETGMLLLRFRDGSWLRVEAEETPSDLHRYLLRQPLTDN